MKNVELKWNPEKEYWECTGCGAIYQRPYSWEPPANWCMKCHSSWFIERKMI